MQENIKLYCGNCEEVMREIPNDSIDLVVTSPPYDNMRTCYNSSFNFTEIATQLYRIVKPGGVVVWVVSDATVDGSESGTSFKQALGFKEIGFNLHDTMIWKKPTFTDTGSLQIRYGNAFEYMFILSKGKPKAFNPIKDRKNIYANIAVHGTRRTKDGKMVNGSGNIMGEYGQRFNVWEIPAVVSCTEKTSHPAQFPVKLAQDHIISWSNEGDTVLDPFMGSGTTGVACKNTCRNFVGIEIEKEYFDMAKKRIGMTEESLF